MSQHTAISPAEAADRLAIRELVEACAYCADRRDAEGQMALFTPDTHFVVYMDAKNPTPSQELHSREALAPIFADLNKAPDTADAGVQELLSARWRPRRADHYQQV
jgi:SnoaL-like domain